MAVTVVVKDQAKVRALQEVANFFESRYPAYYRQCIEDMSRLRQCSKAEYSGGQGRTVYVTMKVPTVLWMACEAAIPGFGQDSDDVALFTKTLTALSGHKEFKAKDRLFLPESFDKEPAAHEDPLPPAKEDPPAASN